MRISPVGFALDDLSMVLKEAANFTSVTHNHPEGIRGAQAVASAIYLARRGDSKDSIREFIVDRFGYDISRTLDEIRPDYQFDESCQGTVRQAIICFLESTDFEDAIRNAVSLGGDSDTLACIAGGIAQACYGEVPGDIIAAVEERLDQSLWRICREFSERFGC
jgi:ADP-ribosylglycohydrolase